MNQYTDAMIATRGTLSDTEFNEVAGKFRLMDGIAEFTRSQHVPRVIRISYNAGKIRAQAILKQLTDLGYNANFIEI